VNALDRYAAKKQLIEKLSGVGRIARIRASIHRKSIPNRELNPEGYWNAPRDLKLALSRAESKIERRHLRREIELQKDEAVRSQLPWKHRLLDKLLGPRRRLPEAADATWAKNRRPKMDREWTATLLEAARKSPGKYPRADTILASNKG